MVPVQIGHEDDFVGLFHRAEKLAERFIPAASGK